MKLSPKERAEIRESFRRMNLAQKLEYIFSYDKLPIVLFYIFPLIASVSNTNLAMLKFSFLIGIRYLFCTILIFGVNFAMFFVVVRVFAPMIVFGVGMCAMIISHFLYKVIDACSYVPEEEDEPGTGGDDA